MSKIKLYLLINVIMLPLTWFLGWGFGFTFTIYYWIYHIGYPYPIGYLIIERDLEINFLVSVAFSIVIFALILFAQWVNKLRRIV